MTRFSPNLLPMLIGSMPLKEAGEAIDLVFRFTPEIPVWPQLPVYAQEGMVPQFAPGMPGLTRSDGREYVDKATDGFDDALLAFYEDYLTAGEDGGAATEKYALTKDVARGFFQYMAQMPGHKDKAVAVKGQVTGPITFCTAMKDAAKRAIFYDDPLRDAAVKLLALKAGWQVKALSRFNLPVIMFIDEPALAGFGSSDMISISAGQVKEALGEVIDAVHAQGGLAGIHVCANTDWSLILESEVDIVNFDAYAYFEKFILFSKQIKAFFDKGGLLAWGIVPTLVADDIEKETADSLFDRWTEVTGRMKDAGVDKDTLARQSFITPACGLGSQTPELAVKVLTMLRAVAEKAGAAV